MKTDMAGAVQVPIASRFHSVGLRRRVEDWPGSVTQEVTIQERILTEATGQDEQDLRDAAGAEP